jgi:acyl-coenzyme A thioesterase PaaI-like protein
VSTGADAGSIVRNTIDPALFDPWNRDFHARDGGDEFAVLMDRHRRFMDALALARPSAGVMQRVAAGLGDLAALLAHDRPEPSPDPTGVSTGFAGRRYDLPARGHPHLVPLVIDQWTSDRILGAVTFGPQYLGGNGAVHGGVLSMLFDEVLGRLANTNRTIRCRTAYLRTDYPSITVVGRAYRLDATVDGARGRKRYLSARLIDLEGTLAAEGSGLFVDLREGQP